MQNVDGPMRTFDATRIRVELFKLVYDTNEFVLNDKADAYEAFDFILTQLHTWIQSAISKQKLSSSTQLDELAQISCLNEATRCFVHETFFMNHQQI